MKSNSEGLIIDGVVAYIDRDNIDTDQIIPTEYLKSIKKFGFEDYLFDGWRYKDDGKLGITKDERVIDEKFILNKNPFNESKILLTRDNFGCGSSREHAVWALMDYGFEVVISTSFADIFYNNCFKNGILPLKVTEDQRQALLADARDEENPVLEIDLPNQIIKRPNGVSIKFDLDPFRKECLLEGLDDISLTLAKKDKIQEYENVRNKSFPWL